MSTLHVHRFDKLGLAAPFTSTANGAICRSKEFRSTPGDAFEQTASGPGSGEWFAVTSPADPAPGADFCNNLVSDVFNRVLCRAPTTSELATAVADCETGSRRPQLTASFKQTSEYKSCTTCQDSCNVLTTTLSECERICAGLRSSWGCHDISWTTSGKCYVHTECEHQDTDTGSQALEASWPAPYVEPGPPTANGYVYHCESGHTFEVEDFGKIIDGLGSYAADLSCSWLLSCSDPSHVPTLSFSNFSTEAALDVLTMYDGNSDSAAVIATADGSTRPSDQVASGNQMLVSFTSDATNQAAGFEAMFTCVPGEPLTRCFAALFL